MVVIDYTLFNCSFFALFAAISFLFTERFKRWWKSSETFQVGYFAFVVIVFSLMIAGLFVTYKLID